MEQQIGILMLLTVLFSNYFLKKFKLLDYINSSLKWRILLYLIESLLIILGFYLFNEYQVVLSTTLFFIHLNIIGREITLLFNKNKN
jgi:hypothetical protein